MSIVENTDSRQQKIKSHFFGDTDRVINHLLNMTDKEFFYWGRVSK